MTKVKSIAYWIFILALWGCHRDTSFISNQECKISDLVIETGECTSTNTYHLTINFRHNQGNNQHFDVYIRNNIKIGTFKSSDLPIKIKDFKRSGNSHDFIKVVAHEIPGCFAVAEFKPPVCEKHNCSISDLKTETGECTSDNTYNLYVNFKHNLPANTTFDLFTRNNHKIGSYKVQDLPIKINDFHKSGSSHDFIKVVINGYPDCYLVHEFKPPECKKKECSISNVVVHIGECTSDNTYNLHINFNHANAGNALFNVYIRDNKLVGTYKLSELPIKIKDFKLSGRDHDFIRVCINDNPDCCKIIEFKPPNCKD
ncbi:MAG: hypothetical protein M3413_06035 [Bacteroidota bacterium]|nr:hypothetical protein [Bacteroidota bacterium]